MFQQDTRPSKINSAITILELIYHSVVRNIRKTHGNAVLGLLSNMTQTLIFVGVFYFMFSILGLKRNSIRGDFLLYIMSGIFMFITHVKSIGAVVGSDGPTSPMMKHRPMNTVISITSSAISTLYTQVFSVVVILFIYDLLYSTVEIQNPVGAFAMLLLAWATGCSIGLVFLAMKPWAPGFVGIGSQLYNRANMIASGKMFVANQTPAHILVLFTWNPLFHIIDQARGFTFINYYPQHSSVTYPIYVAIALTMIGLMGEFYTRRHASQSWDAHR